MRILFIGAVEFSEKALKHLLHLQADICGVITKPHSNFNTDHVDLGEIANNNGIPLLHCMRINEETVVDWAKSKSPDIVFCFGWSELLKEPMLHVAPQGVVGFHPAALPQNRGRHPLIWALVLGLPETASTFFSMSSGADDGQILSQKVVPILEDDYARDLYDRVTETALVQIQEMLDALTGDALKPIPQLESLANHWRKRGPADGRIDFRMSARNIYNLVRGLSRPYAGAHVEFEDKEYKVWRCLPCSTGKPNDEPGKVISIVGGMPVIKCGQDAILIEDSDLRALPLGSYL